ncbi:MAG: PQQ-binding-like beta-propeller repeat protein [bacterium]|nr:PQQ-binding-like beta-propeller repeat protein [bacterium]
MGCGSNKCSTLWGQATLRAAIAAGAFTVFVAIVMARTWQINAESNPTKHPELISLRDKLTANPGSQEIITEIRQKDLALRKEFFRTMGILDSGRWLLLIGAGIFVTVASLAISARKKPPMPTGVPRGSDDLRTGLFGRIGIAIAAVALTATAMTVPILTKEVSTRSRAKGIWSGFRGPGGSGISPYTNVPMKFDGIEGTNIAWKSIVPLNGQSSPAVWDNRVFITGANKKTREVYCFDALSGKITWRKSITASPNSTKVPPGVMDDETSYAAPTPVIDTKNKRIYVMFANGDVACLDVFGKIVWQVHLGTPDNEYGHASSPVLWKNNLIIQLDQGPQGGQEKLSALIALNADTGKQLWRTPRPVGSSWPTPIIAPVRSGDQLITCANPFVISYDPSNGKEIWRADCLEGDGGPSPIYAADMVLATNVGSKIAAIRPDGKGDVTKTHLQWTFDEGMPDTCSPLSDGKLLWLMSEGEFTCLEVKTGKRLWNKDFEAPFYASPALVGNRIYLITRKGKVHIIASGRELKELARADLGEPCDTSPAFADGRIYIRGKTHLYCIEEQNK